MDGEEDVEMMPNSPDTTGARRRKLSGGNDDHKVRRHRIQMTFANDGSRLSSGKGYRISGGDRSCVVVAKIISSFIQISDPASSWPRPRAFAGAQLSAKPGTGQYLVVLYFSVTRCQLYKFVKVYQIRRSSVSPP